MRQVGEFTKIPLLNLMDRQQAQEVLTIVFGSSEFISDGQGSYAGCLISGAQKTLDEQTFKIDFISNKLADMEISEDVVEQHPEGFDLAGKLRQLDKT